LIKPTIYDTKQLYKFILFNNKLHNYSYIDLIYRLFSYIGLIYRLFSYIGYFLRLIKFQILFNLQHLIATWITHNNW
jgi:hypothetical protein